MIFSDRGSCVNIRYLRSFSIHFNKAKSGYVIENLNWEGKKNIPLSYILSSQLGILSSQLDILTLEVDILSS